MEYKTPDKEILDKVYERLLEGHHAGIGGYWVIADYIKKQREGEGLEE
tara:strand:+ start:894 stop:1037 length:144 start_codon:yes stop_codon:yes gene_type:complete